MSRLFTLAAVLFSPALALTAPVPAERPKDIDLVLCLDVSGSMNGLIDSAKLKLWDMVNQFARVKPVPHLRVALYSYGHSGYPADKGWVRKEIGLNTDLDDTYAQLSALKTGGGEEYVARVTQAALENLTWSDKPNALRIIFVCGNESAEQDKQVPLAAVVAEARKKGVIVNTIYCSRPGITSASEITAWQEFAVKAGGRSAIIDQDKARNEVTIATPFDKQLLELNGRLNGTYVAYGAAGKSAAANQLRQDTNAAAAPQGGGRGGAQVASQAAIARAESKANSLYRNGNWDVVDRMKDDKDFDVNKLKEEELGDELRKLKPEERVEYVKKKAEERASVQKDINDLSAKRSAYIAEERKKQPKSPGEAALDDALKNIIHEQATANGFEISTPEKK